MAEIKFVTKVGRDGWLLVQLDGGERISLPQFLKVQAIKTQNGRDYFQIAEGPYKGKSGSVSRKSPAESYFSANMRHTPTATVRFSVDEQKLWYGNNRTPINTFSGKSPRKTPVSKGTYKLQIPYAPSAETRAGYYAYTDFHKTWFRLNLDPTGDRFLHVGEISHGCVTVRAFLPDLLKLPAGFDDLTPGGRNSLRGRNQPAAAPAARARWFLDRPL